ncbi:MAG: ATP-binding cassette domain-containing protein [Leptospirales bacterium]
MSDPIPGGEIIAVRDLVKTFPGHTGAAAALKSISFVVRPGTVTGLIGPDGAGKTTLMRILSGLILRDSGSVSIMGHDPEHDPLPVQRSLGYMPQKFGLYEDLTVKENLDFHSDLHGVPSSGRKGIYEPLLSMTGLGPYAGRLAGKLSGGMKQKLGIACSLLHKPLLLLLDEPTVGVDPVSRRELWEILHSLVQDSGSTLFISTAYLDEAERCDDILILHEGGILGSGSPGSFRSEVQGHAFELIEASGRPSRALEPVISALGGVIDTVLAGDHLRIVMEGTTPPRVPEESGGFRFQPVPPRFEDALMTRLWHSREDREKGRATRLPWVAGKTIQGRKGEQSIRVEHLTRDFGSFRAVNDLSFEVGNGEVFGLLGANGAGKTTTFRMLAGLLPPTGGSLMVAGEDVRKFPAKARQNIGYMAQKFSLYGQLTVHQNLRFYSSAYGISGKAQTDRIQEVLEFFELTPYRDISGGLLPLGFRQRLALAASLMHTPAILLLDEPTSGVDPNARRAFWRIINGLVMDGVSVLVTTHFMEEAEYCDRLAIMADGGLLALGSPSEIKARARTDELPAPTLEDAFVTLLSRAAAPSGLPA